VIGIAVGPPGTYIPEWRRAMGAVTPEVVHAPAATWLGPACNLSHDPALRLIPGWQIEAPAVTCWACRNLQEARQ
jgi:hypothetical protein